MENVVVLHKINGDIEYNPVIENLNIIFEGNNNKIELYEPFTIIRNFKIHCIGDNSYFSLGKYAYIKTLNAYLSTDAQLIIGESCTFESVSFPVRGDKNAIVKIGNDCMFSYEIIIRNSDVHKIFDIETNELLNPNKPVEIGDHVWVGAKTTILKGSTIPSNCVIGTHSIVNKKLENKNSIYVGSPVELLKTGINWSREKINIGVKD